MRHPEPYCVLLANRSGTGARDALPARRPSGDPGSYIATAIERALTVTSRQRVIALTSPRDRATRGTCAKLGVCHWTLPPSDQGTAINVLLALLRLELTLPDAAPVVFLPDDQVVRDETVVSSALQEMADWILQESDFAYLLGARPWGPHNELGYIVPWLASYSAPAGVYEFIERPTLKLARRLINDGALWNTFIFGGTLRTLIGLFQTRFHVQVAALRTAVRDSDAEFDGAMAPLPSCGPLHAADFCQHVLAPQIEKLRVLRLGECGWWPLKPPSEPLPRDSSFERDDEPPASTGTRTR